MPNGVTVHNLTIDGVTGFAAWAVAIGGNSPILWFDEDDEDEDK